MRSKPVIHVGVDGSWRDTGALEWALQESLLRREPLQVVHVIDDRLHDVTPWEPEAVGDAAKKLVNDVQNYLDGLGALDHQAELLIGPPAGKLIESAVGSRMLVVGRRGMGTFRRLLIGSTSEAVVADAAVPVVVVPDRWTQADHSGPVLVALDDDDDIRGPMEFATALATERGLPVRLVHVWDLPAIYSWDAMNVAGLSGEWAENAERHLENVAADWRTRYPDLQVQVEVRRGHVIDGLVTAAAESDAQVVVVGRRHHSRLASLLLGSVTRGVLHHAACPLAVVPAST